MDNPLRDVAALDITAADIDRAEKATKRGGILPPPITEHVVAVDRGDARAHVVFESMQVTGSFKVRGALAAIASRIDDARARSVVACSAGNHGAGVAYASRVLGVRATIVVPRSVPAIKAEAIESEGATLVRCGDGYDEAEAHALSVARDLGAVFISPYDDIDVAAGNGGTLARDLVRALGRRPSAVIVPVGGGGLASGMTAELGEVPVYGSQSEACPAMAESFQRGAAIEAMNARENTLAEGLEGGVTRSGFIRARRALSGIFVVSERAIGDAMQFARTRWGVVIEGSAAVALAPFLAGDPRTQSAVIVLTGRNVD